MNLTFTKAMMASIVAGKKTQTRRPMLAQPPLGMKFVGYANCTASFKDKRTGATFTVANPYTDIEHDLGNGLRLKIRWLTCERLGDITEYDCVKQGVDESIPPKQRREEFQKIWQSIFPSGENAWDPNLWVWVISFDVEKNKATRIETIVNEQKKEKIMKFLKFAASEGVELTQSGRILTSMDLDELIKKYLEPLQSQKE